MPTLHWIGKEKIINHHLDVPFCTLRREKTQGQPDSGNRIIHGDNLEALKALLPEYEGRVKCIYIDPPYNTGNEGWAYNDNVSDPRLLRWLHKTVGKEGEDLSRHDKWLCMMYPRLRLLHKLLADDGAIFISIDDNEQAHLRIIMDEIFGAGNFVAELIWKSRQHLDSRSKTGISNDHEYILIFAKRKDGFRLRGKERDLSKYSNPDSDPRGLWMSRSILGLATAAQRPNLHYEIVNPIDGKSYPCPTETGWRYSKETMRKLIEEERILFPKKPDGRPREKVFLENLQSETTGFPSVINDIFTDGGTLTIREIFDSQIFDFPKPPELIEMLVGQIATSPDSIILDSFAGSGTTAHAVLNLNQQDGGDRKFILIEMEDYADTLTAERVRRVIDGYADKPGTGGGFDFYSLGEPLFGDDGYFSPTAGEADIRRYVWHAETRQPWPKAVYGQHRWLLGTHEGTDWWFCYEREQVVSLDLALLATLKTNKKGTTIVAYADYCTLPDELLKRENIRFKKIPRDVPRL